MDRATFFTNFELLAEAPNGLAKIRDLILQLAVRGKLTHQVAVDQEDPTWQQFLTDFDTRPPRPDLEGMPPLDLPGSWRWTGLREVAVPCGQKKPDASFTYIDVGSIDNRMGAIKPSLAVIEPGSAPSRARKLVQQGSVIYSTVRPYLLNVALIDREFDPPPIVSTAFAVLYHKSFLEVRWLFHWLRSQPFSAFVGGKMKGVAYPAISDSEFWRGPIPLPPPTEQRRIVAKIEELMTLCDELEVHQKARNNIRIRLQQSALQHLAAASEPKSQAAHWLRVRDHFHILHDTPDSIPRLRQAILQLAVQGRLVSGSPIFVEWNGVPRLPPPVESPTYWVWTNLENLLEFGPTNGLSPKPVVFPTATKVLTLSATTSGYFRPECFKYVDQEIPNTSNLWLRDSDILVQRGNSLDYVGISAVYTGEPRQFIHPDLMMKLRVVTGLLPEFVHFVLNSPFGRTYFRERATGTSESMPKINQQIVRSFPFPLPPLGEQKQIVAKVDNLMSLCDELEERLKQSQTLGEQLLDSVVQQVLGA